MSLSVLKVALFSTCFLVATNAVAQEAQSSEQNKEKINKLDGQIVKVGEKNNYLLNYKAYNVGANLFTLPTGYISASGSAAFNENIAVRLAVSKYTGDKLGKTDVNASVGVPIYFSKMYTGFFIEPGYDIDVRIYSAVGYHWMWDSGFNIYLGAGLAQGGGQGFMQVGYAFGDR